MLWYRYSISECTVIDLMHWRHVSITTTQCWGSRHVALQLRARVVLAEHIGAQPLSQCTGPGQPGGMACQGWPSGCMLGSASFDSRHAVVPFCDVICIWSIILINFFELHVMMYINHSYVFNLQHALQYITLNHWMNEAIPCKVVTVETQ